VRLLDETQASSLIVGDFPKRQENAITFVEISLRDITLSRQEDIQLSLLAKESLKVVIEKIYGYLVTRFDNFGIKFNSQLLLTYAKYKTLYFMTQSSVFEARLGSIKIISSSS